MPRPPWWTPCEGDASEPYQDPELDTQFDKNICFVDTPGHGEGDSNVRCALRFDPHLRATGVKSNALGNAAVRLHLACTGLHRITPNATFIKRGK